MRAGKLSANLVVRFAKSFACVQIFDKLNISPRVISRSGSPHDASHLPSNVSNDVTYATHTICWNALWFYLRMLGRVSSIIIASDLEALTCLIGVFPICINRFQFHFCICVKQKLCYRAHRHRVNTYRGLSSRQKRKVFV